MGNNEYTIDGFIFSDQGEYNAAKHEYETIEYIKANTDLGDYNKMVKLYHRLIEQSTLRTVVGLTFLKELQDKIINEGVISSANIPCIRVEKDLTRQRTFFRSEQNKTGWNTDAVTDVRNRLRNSRIISLFLVAIIIIMILIAIFSDRSVYTNYENKILNKYSSWEEDLNAREKALQEKEE